MMKNSLLLYFLLIVGITTKSQEVFFTDQNLKSCLVGNWNINTNQDSIIDSTEAAIFVGTIACPFYLIENLSGLEQIEGITGLYLRKNALDTIDVSPYKNLEVLDARANSLESISFSTDLVLKSVLLDDNFLTTLDITGLAEIELLE